MLQVIAERAAILQGPLDPDTEALLRPEQVQRLKELDLQWRGPLALANPQMADVVELSDAQRARVAASFQAYQTTLERYGEALRAVSPLYVPPSPPPPKKPIRNRANAQARRFTAPPPTLEERYAKLKSAQKEMEKARKESSEKVLALLTPDQKRRWQAMIGTPFTFRTEQPEEDQAQK